MISGVSGQEKGGGSRSMSRGYWAVANSVGMGHGIGVEGKADVALGANGDDASVTVDTFFEQPDCSFTGAPRGQTGANGIANTLANDDLHQRLAVAGGAGSCGQVVGIGAATY